MNRRGHLSHKIPNVKLRPAPATASVSSTAGAGSSKRRRSPNADDEDILRRAYEDAEDEEASTAALRMTKRPWKNVTLTFTGVENKGFLSPLVKELGGTIESALTVHVTHVVATSHGSAKYDYAINHGIPVMSPSWIVDAHTRWLDGEELDLEISVGAHRLQPFTGFKIAISGIDDIERRKQIIKAVTEHGGVYSKDLDRSCTHLISAFQTDDPKAKSSEKVKWALKEIGRQSTMRRDGRKFTEDEEIKIVYEEWLWDCVSHMGRFKEDKYDARNKRPTARTRAEDAIGGEQEKTRRATDADNENEPAVMKKRKRDDMGTLVGHLLSTTAADDSKTSEPTPSTELSTDPSDTLLRRTSVFEKKASVLHSSRSDSFSVPTSGPSRGSKTNGTTPSFGAKPAATKDDGRMFQGLRFSHVVAEGYQGLEDALVKFGGMLVSEQDRLDGADVDYIVTRLASRVAPEVVEGKTSTVVTECWVEGCCHEKKVLDPDSRLVFRPLSIFTPIPDSFGLMVHISGFSTEDTVYLRRLLKTLGAILVERLSKDSTHLVCAAPKGIKYDRAREWGLQIVTQEWLLSMAKSGQVESEDAFRHAEDAKGSSTTIKPSGSGDSNGLHLSAALTSAMSIAPNLEDGFHIPSVSERSQSSAQTAPGRALQSTPTHIDELGGPAVDAASASAPAGPFGSRASLAGRSNDNDPATALSLNRESERALNGAHMDEDGKPADKIARTVSAPADPSSSRSPSEDSGRSGLKAATVAVISKREGVTEALRMLAERGGAGDGSSGRQKIARRRAMSRPKTSLSTSISHSRLASPDDRSPSPPRSSEMGDAAAGDPPDPLGGGEESMRVTYGDDKERRRLIEAVMKGASVKEKAMESGRGKTESPVKGRGQKV